MTEAVFVHGALVRDGAWWWGRAAEALERRTGIRSSSVLLPSCGEAVGLDGASGLSDDAAALTTLLDSVDDAIVIGHSYGGTVIAEAGRHPAVRQLVLISSYLPEPGESQARVMADEPDPVRVGLDDGMLALDGYDEASFADRFLADCDAATAAAAWERTALQDATAFTTPLSAAGWRGVDSTYLVCRDDRSTSLALQREHARRAARSIELPTGHHPFLSRPDLVVDAMLPAVG